MKNHALKFHQVCAVFCSCVSSTEGEELLSLIATDRKTSRSVLFCTLFFLNLPLNLLRQHFIQVQESLFIIFIYLFIVLFLLLLLSSTHLFSFLFLIPPAPSFPPPSHIPRPEQRVPAVWGQVGSDAAHRSQAAQTGGRHQATVVRLVLVRDVLLFLSVFERKDWAHIHNYSFCCWLRS